MFNFFSFSGAGCIAYCIKDNEYLFLFHCMFKPSKKYGYYVDCGGGRKNNESSYETAIREFHEETMWIYLPLNQLKEDFINNEIKNLQEQKPNEIKKCGYILYLYKLNYIPIDILNKQFEEKRIKENEKGREFYWLTKEQLINSINKKDNTKPLYERINTLLLLKEIDNLN